MAGEPGALVLTIYDKLIDRIKSTRPIRTDGKSLTTGMVYSQLVLGLPIEPRDFMNPWSPMGGATLRDGVSATGAPTPTTSPAGGAPTPATKPAPDPKYRQAIEAAYKTSRLVDHLIMVTNDGSYLTYPTGRTVSFAYDGIINGMQPLPMPPIAPDVQQQIDDSNKVLFKLDGDGKPTLLKSDIYKAYSQNALAYAKAKKDYADTQAAALNDPDKAETWPQDAVFYQQQVDDAWNIWKLEGADQVERAIDIIKSVGVYMQDHMIARAKQIYDAWNLGLSGVTDNTPYAYISPSNWCDPNDSDGWDTLTVSTGEYQGYAQSHIDSQGTYHSQYSDSSTSAGGMVSFGLFSLGADASVSDSQASSTSGWSLNSSNSFHNDARNLSISITYALCEIERPWWLGDLFYMQNWYLVGNPKHAISDGSVDGQVQDKNQALLPMIPTHMLIVRDVRISAQSSDDWGHDGEALSAYANSSSSSSSSSGGGAVGIGPFFAGASHSEDHGQTDASSGMQGDASSSFGFSWDGQTLEIKGSQIVAWLSEVVPATAPLDDPALSAAQNGA